MYPPNIPITLLGSLLNYPKTNLCNKKIFHFCGRNRVSNSNWGNSLFKLKLELELCWNSIDFTFGKSNNIYLSNIHPYVRECKMQWTTKQKWHLTSHFLIQIYSAMPMNSHWKSSLVLMSCHFIENEWSCIRVKLIGI